VVEVEGKGRVLVFSFGFGSSGIPDLWAASDRRAGVWLLDLDRPPQRALASVKARVAALRRPGDIVIASIHWGSNWGYEVSRADREFAHRLIEEAGIDVVHGHSSHHPRPIEVYRGKLILYGCGDLLNDYEGIAGYERFRDDLALLYLARLAPATGRLLELKAIPMQIRRFRLQRASQADALWLRDTLNRYNAPLATRLQHREDGALQLTWSATAP
jgi:poly-gamma-glutamate capsule biosynthesis protein CapA/YwtB (metallophosphatase superfamily)